MKSAYLTSEMDKRDKQKMQNQEAVLKQPVEWCISLFRLTVSPLAVAMVAKNIQYTMENQNGRSDNDTRDHRTEVPAQQR